MQTSALFKRIQQLQGDTPWGHLLDAGTGPKSLSWLAALPTDRWTAVTAQADMAEAAREALPAPPREDDRVIIGNWSDETLLAGERFDTVVLDYLVGAVDAFAPYYQETLLRRMTSLTRGCLYVVGLEPYVPVIADDEVGTFVGDLGQLRDACMLLARDRPYREYPAAWVAAQLRQAGFTVTDSKHFKIRYRQRFLFSQLQLCEDRVERFTDRALAGAMREHIAQLRSRGEALLEKHDGLPYGRDYVVRAVPAS